MKTAVLLLVALLAMIVTPIQLYAQEDKLEPRVASLEQQLNDQSGGAVLFLFGAFCALWAQNTRRNP